MSAESPRLCPARGRSVSPACSYRCTPRAVRSSLVPLVTDDLCCRPSSRRDRTCPGGRAGLRRRADQARTRKPVEGCLRSQWGDDGEGTAAIGQDDLLAVTNGPHRLRELLVGLSEPKSHSGSLLL